MAVNSVSWWETISHRFKSGIDTGGTLCKGMLWGPRQPAKGSIGNSVAGQDISAMQRCCQMRQSVHRSQTRPEHHPGPARLAFGLVREAPHRRRSAWGRDLLPQQTPAGVDHLQQQPISSDYNIGLVARMLSAGAASGLHCRALKLLRT